MSGMLLTRTCWCWSLFHRDPPSPSPPHSRAAKRAVRRKYVAHRTFLLNFCCAFFPPASPFRSTQRAIVQRKAGRAAGEQVDHRSEGIIRADLGGRAERKTGKTTFTLAYGFPPQPSRAEPKLPEHFGAFDRSIASVRFANPARACVYVRVCVCVCTSGCAFLLSSPFSSPPAIPGSSPSRTLTRSRSRRIALSLCQPLSFHETWLPARLGVVIVLASYYRTACFLSPVPGITCPQGERGELRSFTIALRAHRAQRFLARRCGPNTIIPLAKKLPDV